MIDFTRANDNINDFICVIPEDKRKLKVLLLADPQITDLSQARPGTPRYLQLKNAFYGEGDTPFTEDRNIRVYDYFRELAEKTKPDFIIILGDAVYGETDDSGKILKEFISAMDSIGIPWTMVFGNHDNESAKGVRWQVKQLMDSKLCVFEPGKVTGHSNFNILFRKKGLPVLNFFMVDTNGARLIDNPGEGILPNNPDYDEIMQNRGVFRDQIDWYGKTAETDNSEAGRIIPSFCFMHVPPKRMSDVIYEKYGTFEKIILDKNDDFGFNYSTIDVVDHDNVFYETAKSAGTKGFFFGHEHEDSGSVTDGDIRLTFALKTGIDALTRSVQAETPTKIGGTFVEIDTDSGVFSVNHTETERRENI